MILAKRFLSSRSSWYPDIEFRVGNDVIKPFFAKEKGDWKSLSIDEEKLQEIIEKFSFAQKEAITKKFNEDVFKWAAYNDGLIKIVQEQTTMGDNWCKKLEDKWRTAPPIEHWSKAHYQLYLPYVDEYSDPKRENKQRLSQGIHFYINKPLRRVLYEIRHRDGKVPPETLYKLHTLRPVYRSHDGSQFRLHWDKVITFCVLYAALMLYIGP